MTKPHPGADLEQPGRLRVANRLGAQPEPFDGAPQQHRVADRLGRRDQQQPLRVGRQLLESSPKALLDPPG
jgi:hypothetical protein